MTSTDPGATGSNSIDQNSQFLKLPEIDQKLVLESLNTYCSGDADRIDPWMARIAIAANVAPGSAIVGRQSFKDKETPNIILVQVRKAPFQFEEIPVAVEFLKTQIRKINQPLAQPA